MIKFGSKYLSVCGNWYILQISAESLDAEHLFVTLTGSHGSVPKIWNPPPLEELFVFFSTSGVTHPCPDSWYISHNLTPNFILDLGRGQVFLVLWFCANGVGPQFNDIRINLPG